MSSPEISSARKIHLLIILDGTDGIEVATVGHWWMLFIAREGFSSHSLVIRISSGDSWNVRRSLRLFHSDNTWYFFHFLFLYHEFFFFISLHSIHLLFFMLLFLFFLYIEFFILSFS